jgi:hypothetical protein
MPTRKKNNSSSKREVNPNQRFAGQPAMWATAIGQFPCFYGVCHQDDEGFFFQGPPPITGIIHLKVDRTKQPEAMPKRKATFRIFASGRCVFQGKRGLRSSGKGLLARVPAYE